MSLQLNTKLSTSDCLNLILTDSTGSYSTSNTGGWGTPNTDITTVVSSSLIITTPAGISYNFIPTSGGLPSVNNTASYSIPSTSLGYPTGLQDGIYISTYAVVCIVTINDVTNDIEFVRTTSTYVSCNLQCCIDKMLLNIDNCGCDCDDDKIDSFITAFGILKQIEHAIECGDLNTAVQLSKLGNKFCKNIGCSTCQ